MLRIYKSSAGSGKTYTLVKEFIRLSLGIKHKVFNWEDKYKHILALTFTNKAANEMKSRVISTLEQIAADSNKQLIEDLSKELKVEQAVIIDRAEKILRNILHNYADLSVCTIDSFVHRVIRAFTYDLHLPMSFEVEMDKNKLLTETVELLMDRLDEEDDAVTSAIVEYAESNIEEGKSWNLELSLASLGQELFVEDAFKHLEKLGQFNFKESRKLRDSIYGFKISFEQKLFAEARKAMELITSRGLDASSFFQSNRGIYGFFEKYAGGEFPGDALGNSYVKKTIAEDKWTAAKVSGAEQMAIDAIKAELISYYNNIVRLLEKDGKDYYLSKLLLRNYYAFILLAEIQKLMDEYKKENNILHISEFQRMVHNIVKQQDAPVIYERIGDWYDNILIDEHQDTSVLQWQNLLPLVENSQFKDGDSLVVGDGKQAIYRFRNGKVEQFVMLPEIYGSDEDVRLKERETAIMNYGVDVKYLSNNWRSRKEIIEFNNRFYEVLAGFPELTDKRIYEGQAQEQGRKDDGGYVSIEFLKDDDEGVLEVNRCKRTEAIIREATERGYSYSDIAVLTRSNYNASLIASYLVEKGIPVISSESLLINNSPRVKLILSTLYYLESKENHIARAEMAYYIHLLGAGKTFHFEQFNFKEGEEQFEENISTLLGKKFSASNFINYQLIGLAQALIRFYGIEGHDPFLQFFMDEIISFNNRSRGNVREFLEWWDEVKFSRSIIYPETLDAVKVGTIHKSKGLEFPVVIMADADWPQKNTKSNFWVDLNKPWLKDMAVGVLPVSKDVLQTEFAYLYEEEEALSFLDVLNLVYVGTTRAEDMLYILGTELAREPAKNNSVTALLINFLKAEQLWDGYKVYQFGDALTGKISGHKKSAKREVYHIEKSALVESGNVQPVIRKTAELLWNEDVQGRLKHGRLMHEIMRNITYTGDLENVLNKFFAEGILDESTKSSLQNDIDTLLKGEKLAPYFMPPYKIINERGIVNKDKLRIPDRVVFNGKEAAVIDYKTGEVNEDYKYQLNAYAKALTGFGFRSIKKLIVYTDKMIVTEV